MMFFYDRFDHVETHPLPWAPLVVKKSVNNWARTAAAMPVPPPERVL
ncbi:MAG TPA: hypothetical protein VHB79_30330 [Polyangiaceae bacterium]|nr:hypothetical protein [Polyangiaceae bacterium]